MVSVCVMMSTYNGELYLKEQLDSILHQKNVKLEIYVRDDKSSDRTVEILRQYECIYHNIHLIESNQNLGPANSFMELLYNLLPSYEYYSFADQDDIWDEDKLIQAVRLLEKEQQNQALLYCSNQMLFINGVQTNLRFREYPNYSFVNTLCGNSISGCTMVFNKILYEYLINKKHRPSQKILNLRMHDVWVLLVAEVIGKVVYDPRSFINYRIHESNTVGINTQRFAYKLKKVVAILGKSEKQNGRSETAKELIEKIEINDAKINRILEDFAYYKKDKKIKKDLIRNPVIKRECEEKRGIFLVKVFFNWI